MVTPATTTPDSVATPELAATAVPVPVSEVAPAPAPEPVATEPSVPTLQEELNNLRREVAQAKAARNAAITQATLQREAQAVYEEEIAAGLSAEDALRIAKRHYATGAQAMTQQQAERDKQTVAEYLARKYNVPAAELMSGTSGEHMEEMAQRLVLEKRLTALEKRQVSAQTLNSPGGAASAVVPTADNIDKLWFDFEVEHPGAANPYEAAYRKAMER